jgi:hypothetical protein
VCQFSQDPGGLYTEAISARILFSDMTDRAKKVADSFTFEVEEELSE